MAGRERFESECAQRFLTVKSPLNLFIFAFPLGECGSDGADIQRRGQIINDSIQ